MDFLPVEKIEPTDPHQHLLNTLWRPTSGCEHSEAFQQWQQQQRLTSHDADFYKHEGSCSLLLKIRS